MAYVIKVDDREFQVEVSSAGSAYVVTVDGKECAVEFLNTRKTGFVLMIDNKPYTVRLEADDQVMVNGERFEVHVFDEQVQKLLKASPDSFMLKELTIKAPMPGLVLEVLVSEGDKISRGQGLFVIEAMKMQNEMKAPRDGIIKQILVNKGQIVNSHDRLIIIE